MPNHMGVIRRLIAKVTRRPLRPMHGQPLTDIDGNVYQTVLVGGWTWMAENLRVTRFSDGSEIPHITDNDRWSNCDSPGFCFLGNTTDPVKQAKYGALYNWRAALNAITVGCTQKPLIAPSGWRLPGYYDWARLELFLMNNHYYSYLANEPYPEAIAKAMASKTDWSPSPLEATPGYECATNNRSLFNASPVSFRSFDGAFGSIGYDTAWWRSGGFDSAYPGMGSCVRINHDSAEVLHLMVGITRGFSVRLIKEKN